MIPTLVYSDMATAQRMLETCSGPQLRTLHISIEWDLGPENDRFFNLASVRTNFTSLRSLALHCQVRREVRIAALGIQHLSLQGALELWSLHPTVACSQLHRAKGAATPKRACEVRF